MELTPEQRTFQKAFVTELWVISEWSRTSDWITRDAKAREVVIMFCRLLDGDHEITTPPLTLIAGQSHRLEETRFKLGTILTIPDEGLTPKSKWVNAFRNIDILEDEYVPPASYLSPYLDAFDAGVAFLSELRNIAQDVVIREVPMEQIGVEVIQEILNLLDGHRHHFPTFAVWTDIAEDPTSIDAALLVPVELPRHISLKAAFEVMLDVQSKKQEEKKVEKVTPKKSGTTYIDARQSRMRLLNTLVMWTKTDQRGAKEKAIDHAHRLTCSFLKILDGKEDGDQRYLAVRRFDAQKYYDASEPFLLMPPGTFAASYLYWHGLTPAQRGATMRAWKESDTVASAEGVACFEFLEACHESAALAAIQDRDKILEAPFSVVLFELLLGVLDGTTFSADYPLRMLESPTQLHDPEPEGAAMSFVDQFYMVLNNKGVASLDDRGGPFPSPEDHDDRILVFLENLHELVEATIWHHAISSEDNPRGFGLRLMTTTMLCEALLSAILSGMDHGTLTGEPICLEAVDDVAAPDSHASYSWDHVSLNDTFLDQNLWFKVQSMEALRKPNEFESYELMWMKEIHAWQTLTVAWAIPRNVSLDVRMRGFISAFLTRIERCFLVASDDGKPRRLNRDDNFSLVEAYQRIAS